MKPISEQIKQLIEQNVLKEGEESSQMNQLIDRESTSSDESDEDEEDVEDEDSDAAYEDARSEARSSKKETESSDDDDSDDQLFKHEVKTVLSWMNHLSPCQQLISVLSIMATMNESQMLFVSNHLQFQLQSQSSSLKKDQSDANSLSFWQSFFLANPSPTTRLMLDLLLEKLPLVSPMNNSCNSPLSLLYLHLVTSTLNKVTSSRTPSDKETLEKCRQLLSLSLVASIFSSEQKKNFLSIYTSKLMIQSNENSYIESTLRSSQSRKSDVPSGDVFALSKGFLQPNSVSSAPTSTSSSLVKPFSGEGMSGVPGYLKGLRLHKYTPLFASLPSLNQFLNLTDDQLESLGVAAKGARKKFVQSLEKLKQRPLVLKSLLNSTPNEILPSVSEVISTPLSKESLEVNLVLHLLLKVKNEMGTENEKEFQEVILKCLQQPIWTREQMRLLIQLKDCPTSLSTSIPRSSSAQASLASSSSLGSSSIGTSSSSSGGTETTGSSKTSVYSSLSTLSVASSSDSVKVASGSNSASAQLDKDIQSLCLSMTENALKPETT